MSKVITRTLWYTAWRAVRKNQGLSTLYSELVSELLNAGIVCDDCDDVGIKIDQMLDLAFTALAARKRTSTPSLSEGFRTYGDAESWVSYRFFPGVFFRDELPSGFRDYYVGPAAGGLLVYEYVNLVTFNS